MAIRWRNHGQGLMICAAKCEPMEDDCGIDDALHYHLSLELHILKPDINEKENGLWHWSFPPQEWREQQQEKRIKENVQYHSQLA